jgi:hypothetical protein
MGEMVPTEYSSMGRLPQGVSRCVGPQHIGRCFIRETDHIEACRAFSLTNPALFQDDSIPEAKVVL